MKRRTWLLGAGGLGALGRLGGMGQSAGLGALGNAGAVAGLGLLPLRVAQAAADPLMGRVDLGAGLSVTVRGPWMRLGRVQGPTQVWTQQGRALDQLRWWAGLASGEPLRLASGAELQSDARTEADPPPVFEADMDPARWALLFERLWAREGVLLSLAAAEPVSLAGQTGLRLVHRWARRVDGLPMRSTVWAVVQQRRLYAAAYLVPEALHRQLQPAADALLAQARLG